MSAPTNTCDRCKGTRTVFNEDWEGFEEWRARRQPQPSPEDEDDLVEHYFIVTLDQPEVPPMQIPCKRCNGTGRA